MEKKRQVGERNNVHILEHQPISMLTLHTDSCLAVFALGGWY